MKLVFLFFIHQAALMRGLISYYQLNPSEKTSSTNIKNTAKAHLFPPAKPPPIVPPPFKGLLYIMCRLSEALLKTTKTV